MLPTAAICRTAARACLTARVRVRASTLFARLEVRLTPARASRITTPFCSSNSRPMASCQLSHLPSTRLHTSTLSIASSAITSALSPRRARMPAGSTAAEEARSCVEMSPPRETWKTARTVPYRASCALNTLHITHTLIVAESSQPSARRTAMVACARASPRGMGGCCWRVADEEGQRGLVAWGGASGALPSSDAAAAAAAAAVASDAATASAAAAAAAAASLCAASSAASPAS
jgi:hypothetical protein